MSRSARAGFESNACWRPALAHRSCWEAATFTPPRVTIRVRVTSSSCPYRSPANACATASIYRIKRRIRLVCGASIAIYWRHQTCGFGSPRHDRSACRCAFTSACRTAFAPRCLGRWRAPTLRCRRLPSRGKPAARSRTQRPWPCLCRAASSPGPSSVAASSGPRRCAPGSIRARARPACYLAAFRCQRRSCSGCPSSADARRSGWRCVVADRPW